MPGDLPWLPFGPLTTLAGEALFISPWIWLPLVLCGITALRHGSRDGPRWLLVCMALPPILLFGAVSVRSNVLFHWAAPGYLMLLPLLGEAVARRISGNRLTRVWLVMTFVTVVASTVLVMTEVRFNWLFHVGERFELGHDPDLDALDWTALAADLDREHLLGRPDVVVAATRWNDAGKVDYALGGRVPVLCLGTDQRQYGLIAKAADYAGDDVVIVAPRLTRDQVAARYGFMFDSVELLPATLVLHAGRPAMLLPLYLGRRLHPSATLPTR